jgi:hypothetical protein
MDFTLPTYVRLLEATTKYSIVTVSDFLSGKAAEPFIVLRHDVDKNPYRAARMAKLENRLGVHATYYFRWDPKLLHVDRGYPSGTEAGGFPASYVLEAKLYGHEVGYHYENLSSLASKKGEALRERALADFTEKLASLRKIAPVATVSAVPSKKPSNSELLVGADLKALQLLGDTSLSSQFGELPHISDAGRRWRSPAGPGTRLDERVKGTDGLIELLCSEKYPRLMLSVRPANWAAGKIEWALDTVMRR